MRALKCRLHFRAALAAGDADEIGFDVGEPDVIAPAVGAGFDVVAAAVVAAIDQHLADAGGAQLAEGDFLGGWSVTAPLLISC